ncbi:MAG: methyltransferase regulatory domain-containing protein [Rhodobacteraceae bacterium]|nr:methyltransferase regulatory domain-containing protein [Paracoccaceae bacterium]
MQDMREDTGLAAEQALPSTAEDYDSLPYRSVAYAASSPENVAALARLFGQEPVSPDRARVLELGCASGGNILPLAIRFPNARFQGIDLSRGQVEQAQARIKALGLKNIEIRYGDIATETFDEAAFDYMIVHGVWSWIPEAAQDAVFAIARRSLVPGGLAYISYNTYPGWHMRQTVRDLCSYHAGVQGRPELRVARARWLLDKLGAMRERGLYSDLFRQEAELNARQPDSYILGEFLADHNSPCYFHEFVSRAQTHGLAFLCEADLAASIPETQDTTTAKLIREIAGDSGLAIEQYMDFFTGRQFRRSILMRPATDGAVARGLALVQMSGLHMAANWRPHPKDAGCWTFKSAKSQASPTDQIVFAALHTAAPGTVPVTDLMQALHRAGLVRTEADAARALGDLFRLSLLPGVELLALPRKVGRASDSKPEVCPLARLEAATGQDWLSSRRHAPVAVQAGLRALVPQIDGTRDRVALERMIVQAIENGGLRRGGQTVGAELDQKARAAMAQELVSEFLAWLEQAGLLLPQIES